MLLPSSDPQLTIKRILKVNHAGETGAMNIYAAQIALARRFFPQIVPELDEMRRDEVEHCRLFRDAMPTRLARPCRVVSLWSLGGYVLGFATGLLGERMVWICTEAVEATVHKHLGDQLRFLEQRDRDLYDLIRSIQQQEEAHLTGAVEHQKTPKGIFHRLSFTVISFLTGLMIWLSTWGDLGWMGPEMARSR
jgi:ubiquinone biosynthesis monooxygenase Coq7